MLNESSDASYETVEQFNEMRSKYAWNKERFESELLKTIIERHHTCKHDSAKFHRDVYGRLAYKKKMSNLPKCKKRLTKPEIMAIKKISAHHFHIQVMT